MEKKPEHYCYKTKISVVTTIEQIFNSYKHLVAHTLAVNLNGARLLLSHTNEQLIGYQEKTKEQQTKSNRLEIKLSTKCIRH